MTNTSSIFICVPSVSYVSYAIPWIEQITHMALYRYTFVSTVPYSSSYQYLTFLSSSFDYLNFRLFPCLTNCTATMVIYIRTALATLIVPLAGPYEFLVLHSGHSLFTNCCIVVFHAKILVFFCCLLWFFSHFLCTALKSDRSTCIPFDNMRLTLINNASCDVYLWFNMVMPPFRY